MSNEVTLGEMAETLSDWRTKGVTPESVEYVVEKVWFDR